MFLKIVKIAALILLLVFVILIYTKMDKRGGGERKDNATSKGKLQDQISDLIIQRDSIQAKLDSISYIDPNTHKPLTEIQKEQYKGIIYNYNEQIDNKERHIKNIKNQ